MELLATIDMNDYDGLTKVNERIACRGIIIKNNKLLMVRSNKGEYLFPGGGVNYRELLRKALIREVNAETGLIVKSGSIKPFGEIVEKRKCCHDENAIFVHKSYYYICDVLKKRGLPSLEPYEREEGYTLVEVTAEEALRLNSTSTIKHSLRENKIIELLVEKNLIK